MDRRFHAEAIACPTCGPRTRLSIEDAAALLRSGHIVAVKGLGGYQLACDATDADAVSRLRAAKHRETKPFALMARDLEVIRRHCAVSVEEAELLAGPATPIVLLRATGDALPAEVAPGLRTLGFMLPNHIFVELANNLARCQFVQPNVFFIGNCGEINGQFQSSVQ